MTKYLSRLFANALARRVAYVLVALALAWCGVGKAHAQAPANACPSPSTGCTETQAYASCMAAVNYTWSNLTPSQRTTWAGYRCNRNATPKYYRCELGTTGNFYGCDSSGVQGILPEHNIHYWSTGTCPNGINPDSGQCSLSCPGGYAEDPWSSGQCLDQQKCLARNALPGFLNVGNIATSTTNRCLGGCEYKAVGGSVCATLGSQTACSADMDFSGNACSGGTQTKEQAIAEKDKKQECAPAGAGQTMCIKPDGQHCYTANSGKQICWGPGETGTKTSDNLAQKRDAGNQPIPPNLNLPNGDTLQQSGTPTTQTTTNVTNNSTTNITTTTTNYVTTNGTNAGTSNNGEPADGSGTAPDDDGTSASGGGDCDTPPVVSGDVALNMVATQTWATRCAVEAGNAANATGDIADCNSSFSVEGNNANALKLRAMRKEICPGEVAMPTINPADYLGDGSGEPTAAQVTTEVGADFDGWDTSGFGFGQSCPAFPTVTIYGHTYDLGGEGRGAAACDIAHILGWFVIFFASLACIRIVTEA